MPVVFQTQIEETQIMFNMLFSFKILKISPEMRPIRNIKNRYNKNRRKISSELLKDSRQIFFSTCSSVQFNSVQMKFKESLKLTKFNLYKYLSRSPII